MMWVRWTFPRLRIDQVITMCWKYCVPISAVAFVGALLWQTYDLPWIRDLGPVVNRSEVRENWTLADAAESEATVTGEGESAPETAAKSDAGSAPRASAGYSSNSVSDTIMNDTLSTDAIRSVALAELGG